MYPKTVPLANPKISLLKIVGAIITNNKLNFIIFAYFLTPLLNKGNVNIPRTMPDKDRKSTRLNSSHVSISYAVFCLKKKKNKHAVYMESALREEDIHG